jgi:hypothetical protein
MGFAVHREVTELRDLSLKRRTPAALAACF